MSAPWAAEVDISEGLVRRLLDEQFPEFRHCRLTLLGEGWDNSAWLLGDDWVFRFPRRQLGADLIASETAVMPAVAGRLPAPVSSPQRIGQPCDAYQWSFAGYPRIPGRELCEVAPVPARRLLLAEQLGQFLRTLHSVTVAEAQQMGAPPDTLGRLDLERRARQTCEHFTRAADLGLIDDPAPWTRLLDRLLPQCPPPREACLVHGDLYSRHVIVDERPSADVVLAGVIDWGDVHVGDPAVDLACAWSLFDISGRQRLLAAYGAVDTGTLALARFRALAHSAICLVYGREGDVPSLEAASKSALRWLLQT